MTDPATNASATSACCQSTSCCTGCPATCPCAARLEKLERRVRRIRICLWIALGIFILLLGIAIGKGSAQDEMMRRRMDGPRMAQPMPNMPMVQGMPGPGPQGPQGPAMQPQGGQGMGPGPGPGPMNDRGPQDGRGRGGRAGR